MSAYALEKAPSSHGRSVAQGRQSVSITVSLHDAPGTKSKYQSIDLNRMYYARPYFESGDWLKVGFSDNGQNGWINQEQLDQAWERQRAERADFHSVFMNETIDKHGKPIVNIVAYENGKRLNDKQAKAMYDAMRENTLKQQAAFSRMNHRFMRMMRHDFANHLFRDAWMGTDFWPNSMLQPAF